MKILYLQDLDGGSDETKVSHLRNQGFEVIAPKLSGGDFELDVRTARAANDRLSLDLVVGSGRGGAIAMNIDTVDTKLILLCPAWKNWGTIRSVKSGTIILHSRADDVIPFIDSEELVRNSGATLIEVGNDHRLADTKTLDQLSCICKIALPVLCIGIDITWWGGSAGNRSSQVDTIVSGVVECGSERQIEFKTVDLSKARNLNTSSTTANFDVNGELTLNTLVEIMENKRGEFSRCVIALDAPLEAAFRPNQPPRRKASARGTPTGSKIRQCEDELNEEKRQKQMLGYGDWNHDLRIQSGSPIPPRVESIRSSLVRDYGFQCWSRTQRNSDMQLIEVFPSEAIWSLGNMNGYGNLTSKEVRQYKAKTPRTLAIEEAESVARLPFTGFNTLYRSILGLPFLQWGDQIANYSCGISLNEEGNLIHKGKCFDDPIDSGIAFMTSVVFSAGKARSWGDGTDGTIIGPGPI